MKRGHHKQDVTPFLDKARGYIIEARALFQAAPYIDQAESVEDLLELVKPTFGYLDMYSAEFDSLEEAKQYAAWIFLERFATLDRLARQAMKPPKASRIEQAYWAIGSEKVPIKEIAEKFNIAIPILYQHKRFDKTGLDPIRIKDKMIWREKRKAANRSKRK